MCFEAYGFSLELILAVDIDKALLFLVSLLDDLIHMREENIK